MEFDQDLYNAAVIGENATAAFIVEGNHLHAVEVHIAELQKEKSNPKLVLPLMRKALKALQKFADRRGTRPAANEDLKSVSLKPNELEQLVDKITHAYNQLPHQDRNELSSLIHHKQMATHRGSR